MYALGVVLLAAGCGRVAFEPLVDAASGDASDSGDTPDSSMMCATGPWSAPQRILSASTVDNEWGGQVSADGLAYYYTSYSSGDGAPFVVRRATRDDAFGLPLGLAELDTSADEGEQAPSRDELEIYFSSDRGVGICIYRATRADRSLPFSNITRLDALCQDSNAASGPYLSHDGLRLYYQQITTFPYGRLMMSERLTRAGAFPPGTQIVLGPEDRGFPSLTADELTLYYEANDNHHQFQVTRTDLASPFSLPAIEMPGIGQESDQGSKYEDGSITADGLAFFFSSNRAGAAGGDDSWFVERSCL